MKTMCLQLVTNCNHLCYSTVAVLSVVQEGQCVCGAVYEKNAMLNILRKRSVFRSMKAEIEHGIDDKDTWWYRCPVCHEPIDYKQEECSWCHLKIDWKGR